MLITRNLRNRVIVEKSNKELTKNNKFSAECKLDEKEDQLVNPNLTKHYKCKDSKKVKSLRSSSLKNKNKPVENEKNNHKNGLNKILAKPSGNKIACKRNCRRETVIQSSLHKSKLSVLKESNFNVTNKRLVNSEIKKNRNIENAGKKDKENNELDSVVITDNFHSKKIVNKGNICVERKSFKAETNVIKHVTNIPIWKRQLNLNKSEQFKKQNSIVDVYDITQDEEIMASEKRVQKKRFRSQKEVNKTAIKKGRLILRNKNQNRKTKFPSCDTLDSGDKGPTLLTNQITSDLINKKRTLEKDKENNMPSDQNANDIAATGLHDENLFLSPSVQINDLNEEHSNSDPHPSESKSENNKFLSALADELEKSFLIPKMTSTPDAIHVKTGVQVQKNGILNVANISSITAVNKNCCNITVATPCDSVFEDHLQKKVEGLGDITLFESPIKKKKKTKEVKSMSPKKSIQINLFGEVVNSPSNKKNLEDSVLKPKKAYHSPDNFKTHLVRTKRISEVLREIKKSKEDILVEKMALHFEEVGGTDLCIE